MLASWLELVLSSLVLATVPSKSALGVCLGGENLRGRGRKRTAVAKRNEVYYFGAHLITARQPQR